jgi:hypothetical protein
MDCVTSIEYEGASYTIITIIFIRFIYMQKQKRTENTWRDIELGIHVVEWVYGRVIDSQVYISIHSWSVILLLSP